MKWKWLYLFLFVFVFLVGCSSHLRTKGGTTSHISATGSRTELVQSDLPNRSSFINVQSKMTERLLYQSSNSFPMVIERTIEDKASNEVGSSWKDKVGETIALMKGMRPVMFAGIAVFLLGAATLHPKLKLILGFSNTQSMVVMAGGLALVFLPSLFAAHGTLIIIITSVAVFGYLLSYRYSKASTESKLYKKWYDDNKDGKVDEGEVR